MDKFKSEGYFYSLAVDCLAKFSKVLGDTSRYPPPDYAPEFLDWLKYFETSFFDKNVFN